MIPWTAIASLRSKITKDLVKSLGVLKFKCDIIIILTPLRYIAMAFCSVYSVANEMQAHMFSTRLRSQNLFDILLGFLNNMTSRLVTILT